MALEMKYVRACKRYLDAFVFYEWQRGCNWGKLGGRTSNKLTFKIPMRILPPATPPLRELTSCPGLLTSKLRMTMSLGELWKSRLGTGILWTMCSQTRSMLYFKTAEMGIMGEESATVPATNFLMRSCCPRRVWVELSQ